MAKRDWLHTWDDDFKEGNAFWFGSGASAWRTILTLYLDGHFEGEYEDTDFDVSYYCKFSGQFGDITKVSEYAYTMRLEELTYETELDKEWGLPPATVGAAPRLVISYFFHCQ